MGVLRGDWKVVEEKAVPLAVTVAAVGGPKGD